MSRTAVLILLFAFGTALPCLAQSGGLELKPGQTVALNNQKFEWRAGIANANREAGNYGLYKIRLVMGATYVIETHASRGGTSNDPYLYLLHGSFHVMAQDDNSGGGAEARIVYTVTEPMHVGLHTIKLRAAAQGTWGTTTLTITRVK